jgi:hypothetical protein
MRGVRAPYCSQWRGAEGPMRDRFNDNLDAVALCALGLLFLGAMFFF